MNEIDRRTTAERHWLHRTRSNPSVIGAAMILIGLAGILAVASYFGTDDSPVVPDPLPPPPANPIPPIAPQTVADGPADQQGAEDVQRIVSGEFVPDKATVNGHDFDIEVARDAAERSKGLGGRASLGVDVGMVFVFPNEGIHRFWMKSTIIPLDLVYIDAGGTVVSVQTMEPELGVPDRDLTIYEPPVPVSLAIELNGGRADETGIAIGMTVDFE